MKNVFVTLYLLIVFWGVATFQQVGAQQLPVSSFELAEPGLFNPAFFGVDTVHDFFITTQNEGVGGNDWSDLSQYFRYRSPDLNSQTRFGWGFLLKNYKFHSDHRLALSPGVATRLVSTDKVRVGLGISAGFIFLNSRYNGQSFFVYHSGDPTLSGNQSMLELDASVGLDLNFQGSKARLNLNGHFSQLPGNILNDLQDFRVIHPMFQGELHSGFRLAQGIWFGPHLRYGRVFMLEDIRSDAAASGADLTMLLHQAEGGLRLDLEQQGLWFMGKYAYQRSIGFNMGLKIHEENGQKKKDAPVLVVNLLAGFHVNANSEVGLNIGPMAEVGLGIQFLSAKARRPPDSLVNAEVIWKQNGFLTKHADKFIGSLGPANLTSTTELYPKKVYLDYSFLDRSSAYLGNNFVIHQGKLKRIGIEWEGVDRLINQLTSTVIDECLHPDRFMIRDPENLDSLQSLTSVDFKTFLKTDETGMYLPNRQRDIFYDGEFSGIKGIKDTVSIDLVVNGQDTTLSIYPGQLLNELELAALKMFAIRSKTINLLNRKYPKSGDIAILTKEREKEIGIEGNWIDFAGKQLILIHPIRIIPNNSNLDAPQENVITLEFSRRPGSVNLDDGYIDRPPPEMEEWEREEFEEEDE